MLKHQAIFAMLAAAALSGTAHAAPKGASKNPLVGAWTVDQVRTADSVDDHPQPSLYIFTGKHYSIVQVTAKNPREAIDAENAPAALLREIYVDGFVANAGRYQASGGKLKIWPSVAKNPSFMRPGTSLDYRYEQRDGALLLTELPSAGSATQGATRRLKRAE